MAISVTSLGARANGQFPVNVTSRLTLDDSYVRGGYALASFVGTPGALVLHEPVKNGKGLRVSWNQASNKLMVFERSRNTIREILPGNAIEGSAATGSLNTYFIAPYSVSVVGMGIVYITSTSATIGTTGRVQCGFFTSAGSTRVAKASVAFVVSKKRGQQTAATFTAFTMKKNDMLDFRRNRQGSGSKKGAARVWIAYRAQPAACEVDASATLASVQVDVTVMRQNRT